jgi:hypothetical protein
MVLVGLTVSVSVKSPEDGSVRPEGNLDELSDQADDLLDQIEQVVNSACAPGGQWHRPGLIVEVER